MIEVLTGLPGFGKTATAAKWAYKRMLSGKSVYSNFPIKGAIPYHEPLEVLGRVKDALILMDEAGLLLDGLKLFEFPYEIFYELRQHRKDGVDLLMTAQSILDIAFPFRRLIQFENRITFKIGMFVQVTVKDPQPGGQQFAKQLWILNSWVFKIYRSYYKVKPPEYLGINFEEQLDISNLIYDKSDYEFQFLMDLLNNVHPDLRGRKNWKEYYGNMLSDGGFVV